MNATKRRQKRAARRVALVAGLAVATVTVGATAANAAPAVRAYMTASVVVGKSVTLSATASVTASATGEYDGITAAASYTAKVTQKATGSARIRVRAGSVATGRSRSLARAAAYRKAQVVAKSRATAKARDLAHDRAYSRAYSVAYAKAWELARRGAATRADTAAQTKAAVSDTRCGGKAIRKADGTYWHCTFDDEFNDGVLDRSTWVPVDNDQASTATRGACYEDSPENVNESGGYLNLTVRKEASPVTCPNVNGKPFVTDYTAAQVSTYTKFAQTYGRFSIRASFPASALPGLQSALWLWPVQSTFYGPTWPTSGELDIAEQYSIHPDRVIPYLHYNYDPRTTDVATNTNLVTNNTCLITDVSAFHEYTLEWTKTTLKVIYDGQTCLYNKYKAAGLSGNAPFDQPFFVALTQTLGTGKNAFIPGTTPLPASTRVDYVRVWK